jgi:uncharacterized SAM-binding protein YcdF (DUF218 family)
VRWLIVGLVVSAFVVWLPFAGTLLVAGAPPVNADAIVVLAGNTPNRLPHALELRAAGYAHRIVVSNENVHTHGLETTWLAIHQAGYSAADLPDSDLIVMDPPPESTIDEARRAADVLSARGLHSALVVTDAFHARRAALLFRAAFARKGLEVRSTPITDTYDLAHYWQHPVSARRVAEEYTKLAYYFVTGALF